MSIAKRLIALAALSTAAFAANATVITYTDNYAPSANVTLSSAPSGTIKSAFTFTHDITDNGFDFAHYDLLSATLTIYLNDFADKDKETFKFDIGTGNFKQVFNGSDIPNGSPDTSYAVSLATSLGDLTADGKISVTVTALTGSFMFTHSELVATAEDHAAASTNVPEPASLALLGLGLGAIGLRRRRVK